MVNEAPAQSAPPGERKYSERLGVLTDRQLQCALDRFDLGRFVHAEPIKGGLFGQNVFVTSSKGEWVLRGCPHGDWQFPKERCIARFLHQRTDVPVPWPYLVEASAEIFGWSYVLMPRMPGESPVGAFYDGLPAEDRAGIAYAIGDTLARLHEPHGPCLGEYDLASDDVRPFPDGFASWITSWVREFLSQARSYSDHTTAEDVAWVEEVIAAAEPSLREPFAPCFVMQDYKRGNMTVQRTGSGWRVSGLFDLMEPYFGDGEADLWRHLAEASEVETRPFLAGYLNRRSFRPGFEARATFYLLADRMRIWEYGQRPDVRWFKERTSLRNWVNWYLPKVQTALEIAQL